MANPCKRFSSSSPLPLSIISIFALLLILLFYHSPSWTPMAIKDKLLQTSAPPPPLWSSQEQHGRSGIEGQRQQQQQQQKKEKLEGLGVLASGNREGWSSLTCDRSRKLRRVSLTGAEQNFTFYVYDSSRDDRTVTQRALKGWYFEREEIARFLNLSRDLPLLDVGANLGLVTLQAAMQGRQVVAIEPVAGNALRLCRSVLDFGHVSLVHVIQNAVSSGEGNVTLAMVTQKARTQYEMTRSQGWGYGATMAYSICLDRLIPLLPFRHLALKIDVEGHEGHVLAGAERLFREVDIPLVWMEWRHVQSKADHGGAFVLGFMHKHHMAPFNLMTGRPLSGTNYATWPFTVLWRKAT